METTKITVKDADLRKGAEAGMDEFLQVFIDKYLELAGEELSAEMMSLFNGYQHTLLGYYYFRREVLEDTEWIRTIYFRQSFCKGDASFRCEGFLQIGV